MPMINNENPTPSDLLFEQIKEQKSQIYHPPLKSQRKRTRKEKERMNGEVISIDPNKRVMYPEFIKCPLEMQKHYISTISDRYENIGLVEFSALFGISYNSTKYLFRKLGIKTNAKHGVSLKREKMRKKFYSDFSISDDEVPVSYSPGERHNDAIVKVKNMAFECDANDIGDILVKFGIKGKVVVQITTIE